MELLYICTSIVLCLYALSLHRQIRLRDEAYQELCHAIVLTNKGKGQIKINEADRTIAFFMGE